MAGRSLPTLRQFISKAFQYGVQETIIEEKLSTGRLKRKFSYLRRDNLTVVVPTMRESDRLTEAVFGYFLRGLQLEPFEDELR